MQLIKLLFQLSTHMPSNAVASLTEFGDIFQVISQIMYPFHTLLRLFFSVISYGYLFYMLWFFPLLIIHLAASLHIYHCL